MGAVRFFEKHVVVHVWIDFGTIFCSFLKAVGCQQLIEKSLAGDMSLFDALQQKSARITKRVRALKVPPRVLVTNARSKTHTVIEVNGTDRPGLLYQITYHLAQMGLQINSASVSTYGEKAVDVFYVKDVFGLQVKREQFQEKIHQNDRADAADR